MAEFISIERINDQLQLKPSFKVKCLTPDLEEELQIKIKSIQQKGVILKQLDEHIWLSIPKPEKKYYSPRLHIEIETKGEAAVLHCTFGPEPNLWTFFMFIHFFLALCFIGLLIWWYSNSIIGQPNLTVYVGGCIIISIWVALYVFARANRKKATPQSRRLLEVLKQMLT